VAPDAQTLNGLLAWAARFPQTGLRVLDRRERPHLVSWSETAQRAVALCGGLQSVGVGRGDRVALVFPTGHDFVQALFAVLLAGAVPVPLYPPARLGRLEEQLARTRRQLEAAGVRLVLADRRLVPLLGRAARPAQLGCRSLASLPPVAGSPETVTPEELALVQFSSGTTSEPKPVALSHRAVTAQVRLLNGFWPDRDGVVHSGVSWLPLYHDMGLIGCVFPALERPGTLSLIPPEQFVARPAVWLRAISRFRATLSPAPNFAFGLCTDRVRDEELEGVDLSSWRVALCGAEPVAPEVMRGFARRFARWRFRAEALTPVYGLSEASLAVTFSEPGQPFNIRRFDRERLGGRGEARETAEGVEIVSLGRPLPGFDVIVVSDDRRRAPEGRVGRVWIRGPSLMEGYLGQPRATGRVLRDGWLDTGDLGFLLRGELFLTGRAKDVIIVRGRNHAPHELEAAVDGVEGARRGCAVAVSHRPEGATGERLLLFVEARRGLAPGDFPALARSVAAAVRAAVGVEPDQVSITRPGVLPRTSSRKLRRAETLARHLEGRLEASGNGRLWRGLRCALDSMVATLLRRLELDVQPRR
jgi:acyl-CoA synthetase (AMP-forming)/AMP-acid ligase II